MSLEKEDSLRMRRRLVIALERDSADGFDPKLGFDRGSFEALSSGGSTMRPDLRFISLQLWSCVVRVYGLSKKDFLGTGGYTGRSEDIFWTIVGSESSLYARCRLYGMSNSNWH